jgi:hypothetical protein
MVENKFEVGRTLSRENQNVKPIAFLHLEENTGELLIIAEKREK